MKLCTETINEPHPSRLYDVFYEIPEEIMIGKDKIRVVFISDARTIAGRVFGVKVTRAAL